VACLLDELCGKQAWFPLRLIETVSHSVT
jgi:hypothetical protein